jgi:hypothetical protein
MACPVLIDPACVVRSVAGHVAGTAADGAMAGLAGPIQSGVTWLVTSTVDWWVQIPSPNLAAEPAVGALQHWVLPIAGGVAVLAMLAAAGKMALTRKANPLVDVGSGLAIIAATSAVGVLLPSMLLKAGDAWSSWVLSTSTGGHFATRLTTVLTLTGAPAAVVIVLGVLAMILTAIQAVLMLFRQAALVILAGVLPLAAAGTLAPATRAWFRRVTGWMLALIFYKPAAAAVYATAFTMIGQGSDPRIILMGFAMVLLSLLALPALLKFFTWTTATIEGPAGGGFLSTVVSGAIAVGALRASSGGAGGLSAVDQTRFVSAQLGPQGGPGPQGPTGPQGGSGPWGGNGPRGGADPGAGTAPGGGIASAGSGMGDSNPGSAGVGGSGSRTGSSGGGAGQGAGAAAGGGGGAAAGASGGGAGASGTGTAAGPVGTAAMVIAEGAATARRSATDAVEPPRPEE